MATSASAATDTVTRWSIHEISFMGRESYANPYLKHDDPLLSVTFVHPDSGTQIVVEGFWDGGDTWRVRFAPTRPGMWTWTSSSADDGLNGKTGSLKCIAPTAAQIAENPNYRGHIKVGPTSRYFVHADGTPFFWLGDTAWFMNSRRCALGDNADGPFYTYLRDRRAKGFTVILAQYFATHQRNEAGYPFPANTKLPGNGDFDELNPDYFKQLDVRVQAIWDGGFVLAAHPTWIGKRMWMPPEDAGRISRYLMARYGAYNIIWSLSGEYQYSYSRQPRPWTTQDWKALGKTVQSCNVFGHPVSVHPSGRQKPDDPPEWPAEAHVGSSGGEFHNEAWLDHNWLQTGQRFDLLWRNPMRVAENYTRTPVKPLIHSEGWYENQRKWGPICTPAHIRWQAWAAFLNGAAGHGYGAWGLWQFHDPSDPESNLTKRDDTPSWQEALSYTGAAQLKHLRDFFTSIEWTALQPHRDWVRLDGRTPELQSLTDPHCAAKPGDSYVIYVPMDNRGKRAQILGLADQVYAARWFNPRDGSSSPINDGEPIDTDDDGTWTAPPVPDDEDWVLHLAAVSR